MRNRLVALLSDIEITISPPNSQYSSRYGDFVIFDRIGSRKIAKIMIFGTPKVPNFKMKFLQEEKYVFKKNHKSHA